MTATCKDRKWFAHRRHTLLPFDSAVSFLEFWSDPCKCCVSSIVLHSEMKYTSFRHFPLLECQRIFPFWCGVQQIFKMTKHHIIITVSLSSKMPNYIIMWLPPEGRNCLLFLFFFPPLEFGSLYFLLYNSKCQHNYINLEVQTTVKSNDDARNKAKKRGNNRKARLFWQCEPDAIMKIGVLQNVAAFQKSMSSLYEYVSACTILYVCASMHVSTGDLELKAVKEDFDGERNVRPCTSDLVNPSAG